MRGLAGEQPPHLACLVGLIDIHPRPPAVMHELLAGAPLAARRDTDEQLLPLLVVARGESRQGSRPVRAARRPACKEVVGVAAGVDRQLTAAVAVPRGELHKPSAFAVQKTEVNLAMPRRRILPLCFPAVGQTNAHRERRLYARGPASGPRTLSCCCCCFLPASPFSFSGFAVSGWRSGCCSAWRPAWIAARCCSARSVTRCSHSAFLGSLPR